MSSKIISAAPSQGKSYYTTSEVIRLLKDGKTVYTNYPVIYKIPYNIKEKLINCHTKLSDSQHDFFATTGHNNIDVYIIAQNYRRINIVIREMALFIIISKFSNPLSLMSKSGRKELTPLFFTVETYLSEREYQLKGIKKDAVYEKKRILFNTAIANSYNTQYYRRLAKTIERISWYDDMQKNNISSLNEIKREEIKEIG